eukprot:gene4219-5196_t
MDSLFDDALTQRIAELRANDELPSAHGPARRELPGAKCDFKDKNGNDSDAAKRTWEFANKADEIFFNSSRSVEKAARAMPDSIAEEVKESLEKAKAQLTEGMKLCEQRAQVAFIAFKDGWNVAKEFSEEMAPMTVVDLSSSEEDKDLAPRRLPKDRRVA